MSAVTTIHKYTPSYSKMPGYMETSVPLHLVDGMYYLGEFSEWEPDYSNPIWDIKAWAMRQRHIKSAGMDDDEMGTKLAGVTDEYYPAALEIQSYVDEAVKSGGMQNYRRHIKDAAILKREDFAAFKTINVQTKILATKPRGHILLDLIKVDNVTEYNTKLYSLDGPYDMVQENLAEMSVPFITGFPNLTPMEFGMERYGMHWAFSEEFLNETFDFNLKQLHIDNAAGQMDLVFNKKVADLFNNESTFTPYGLWDAKTGTQSNRDPNTDILAEATKIEDTERNEDMILLSNRKTYNAFITNTYNNLFNTPSYKQEQFSFGNNTATGFAKFPGLRWGIDSFIAATKFVAFDPSAIYAARMPQRIVDYKSPYGTHQGTIVRQNFIVKTVDANRILGGSGVTA